MERKTILLVVIILLISGLVGCLNIAIEDEIERVTKTPFAEEGILYKEEYGNVEILIYQTPDAFYLLQYDNNNILHQKTFTFREIELREHITWHYSVPMPGDERPNVLWGAVKRGEEVPTKIQNNDDFELKYIVADEHILFYHISDVELNKPYLIFDEFKITDE